MRSSTLRCWLLLGLLGLAGCKPSPPVGVWTDEEKSVVLSLGIDQLPPLPPDPSNAVADDEGAARLGHQLFFDGGLSANGKVSCATCHEPEHGFAGLSPLSAGIGTTARNAPSIIGSAHSPWMFWDGRADSLWAQALGPLQHPDEMGATPGLIAHRVAAAFRAPYVAVFGALPPLEQVARFPKNAGPEGDEGARAAWQSMAAGDRTLVTRVLVNVSKAIAAYERRLMPGASRFDEYVAALRRGEHADSSALSVDELAGLRLFIGEAACTDCHAGPLFTNHDFANVGIDFDPSGLIDAGRSEGVKLLFRSEFTCLGPWSDAEEEECKELRFVKSEGKELLGAMKVPGLRTANSTAPYMHRGQLASLSDVVLHYDRAPRPVIGHSDLEELVFSETELEQLESFLRCLDGGLSAAGDTWSRPPS